MRILLIALTLTASTAFGQTTGGVVVLTTPNNETSYRVAREPCDLSRTVNWTFNGDVTSVCDDLRFWLVAGTSCGDEPASGTTVYELTDAKVPRSTLQATRTGQISFRVNQLPELTCPASDTEKEYRLCASVEIASSVITGCNNSFQKDDLQVIYDAKPPAAPGLSSVAGLDKALSIRVDAPNDANRLKVLVERADGTGSRTVEQSADQTLFRVEGLENNVTYRVTARAVDSADNESEPSEALEGTPIFTRGFFDRYVELGGQETGGCGAAGVGLAGGWVLAVLGLWLSSRRNRS
jgi:uncharacterized protein (TIGR03382 family)